MDSDTLKFITIFNFKDESAENIFLKYINGNNGICITRGFEGCISVDIYRVKKKKYKLIMIEKWNSLSNKKKYLKMRENEGLYKFLNELVKTPLELNLLSKL